jgi:hypothetical protein
MVYVLTDGITPRHRYIFGYLLETCCGWPVTLIDRAVDRSYPGDKPLIAYTSDPVGGAFHVKPFGLLSASGIPEEPRDVGQVRGFPCFFTQSGSDFPFDIFAASFYLISRCEEYRTNQPDNYGRFDHRKSLAFRTGFLDIPLVESWLADFSALIVRRFPELILKKPQFRFQPTYDIDIAYAFRGRGMVRMAGGWIKCILKGDLRGLVDRYRVFRNKQSDPYDAYDLLDALHQRMGLQPRYFFLMAANCRGYDRNLDPKGEAMRTLVRRHAKLYPTGLHPSWRSGDEPDLLRKEKEMLEDMVGFNITMSRQHYIRMKLPQTYRQLVDAGIREDFSMGYGGVNGFRASVSRAFPWYDLEMERETELWVHPYCFMDATGHHELGMTPSTALRQLEGYANTLQQLGGCLTTIFHNSMLGSDPIYAGWSDGYVRFVESVSEQ